MRYVFGNLTVCGMIVVLALPAFAKTAANTWARQYLEHTNKESYVTGVATTRDGGAVLSGYTVQGQGRVTERLSWLMKLDKNGDIDWKKNYDSTGKCDHAVNGVVEATDGFIAVGTLNGACGSSPLIMKVDRSGTPVWGKRLGAEPPYAVDDQYVGGELKTIVRAGDGTYLVSGTLIDRQGNDDHRDDIYGAFIGVIDNEGVFRWKKLYAQEYTTPDPQYPDDPDLAQTNYGGFEVNAAIPTKDGGVLIGGITHVVYGIDAWMGKLDVSGAFVWQYMFDPGIKGAGTRNTYINGVIEDRNGNAVGVGWIGALQKSWIVNVNPQGKGVWQRVFGTGPYNWSNGVVEGDRGTYIVIGQHTDITRKDRQGEGWPLYTFDKQGRIIAQTKYHWHNQGGGNPVAIKKTDDGYVIAGDVSIMDQKSRVGVLRTTRDGTVSQQRKGTFAVQRIKHAARPVAAKPRATVAIAEDVEVEPVSVDITLRLSN